MHVLITDHSNQNVWLHHCSEYFCRAHKKPLPQVALTNTSNYIQKKRANIYQLIPIFCHSRRMRRKGGGEGCAPTPHTERTNSVFRASASCSKILNIKCIYNTVKNFRTNSEVSGPIRIKLKKVVSGQISAPPVKCLPVRLCLPPTYPTAHSLSQTFFRALRQAKFSISFSQFSTPVTSDSNVRPPDTADLRRKKQYCQSYIA